MRRKWIQILSWNSQIKLFSIGEVTVKSCSCCYCHYKKTSWRPRDFNTTDINLSVRIYSLAYVVKWWLTNTHAHKYTSIHRQYIKRILWWPDFWLWFLRLIKDFRTMKRRKVFKPEPAKHKWTKNTFRNIWTKRKEVINGGIGKLEKVGWRWRHYYDIGQPND